LLQADHTWILHLSGPDERLGCLKELKSNQATVDIPIVISSVYENKGIASQNDITEYLVKPFEPEQLIRVVQKALNGKLNSKMMVNGNGGLTDVILEMLKNRGISVKQIEHSGNMLIITLEGEEGFLE
jgi:response regulator RpfG family c-di-GMP phosphodiesterase